MAIVANPLRSAFLTIGVISPSSSATATAMSTVSQRRIASSLHEAWAAGTCRKASDRRADYKVVNGDPVGVGFRVELGAEFH